MSSERHTVTMTVGELSRHTGVPPKALRAYTDWGLVYTAGRSAAGYRLYHTEALWCVRAILALRGLGLTLTEICDLLGEYTRERRALGPSLAERLRTARARIDARITELEHARARIDAFEATNRAALSGIEPDGEIPTICGPAPECLGLTFTPGASPSVGNVHPPSHFGKARS